jgi:ornithine lipid ester-linked acyl 2-hydroxylase
MTQAFYEPARFPTIIAIAERWREILRDYRAIQSELVDYVEPHLFTAGWKVFGLWNLPHREALHGTLEKCPVTTSLIHEQVPGHGAAGFSVLTPGTRIIPHRGWQGHYLRCHIGLDVPAGDCALRVAGETRRWRQGEPLIFDDRLEHEAWNETASARVVLLFDFDPQMLGG